MPTKYLGTNSINVIFENVACGIVVCDKKGNILWANKYILDKTGYTISELIGKNPRIFKSGIQPESIYHDLWSTISSGQVWSGTLINKKKDGSLYYEEMSITPVKNGTEYYVAIKKDITERIDSEAKIGMYIEKLIEKNEQLDEFASAASHDLREPMRKIVAFGERLQKEIGYIEDFDNDKKLKIKNYLTRMTNASMRLESLLNGLLMYSRTNTGDIEFSNVDIEDVIKNVISDLEIKIINSEADVSIIGSLPTIEADATMIRQLFQNLLSNAFKFAKENEKSIVKIYSQELPEGKVAIYIEDNGIGFDERHLGKIFQIFQRLHSNSRYAGTGVGLAICKRIVDRHHGDITAISEEGEGATFIVTLPKIRQEKDRQDD